MIRRQTHIKDFFHLDFFIIKENGTGSLFTFVSRVAFDVDFYYVLIIHLI